MGVLLMWVSSVIKVLSHSDSIVWPMWTDGSISLSFDFRSVHYHSCHAVAVSPAGHGKDHPKKQPPLKLTFDLYEVRSTVR